MNCKCCWNGIGANIILLMKDQPRFPRTAMLHRLATQERHASRKNCTSVGFRLEPYTPLPLTKTACNAGFAVCSFLLSHHKVTKRINFAPRPEITAMIVLDG